MSRALFIALAVSALAAGCGRAPQGAEEAALAADRKLDGPTPAALTPSPPRRVSAADFVAKAAAGDAFELTAARAAEQRGASADVRSFAGMMVRDHTQSAADLQKALATSGQSLSADGAPSPEEAQALDDLAKAPPRWFDKTYMAGQVKAHQDALSLMQDYAQNGDVPSLKAYAAQAAPVVQRHYLLAKSLNDALR